ncbi:hypothetical protein SAMN05421505_107179 [Sinosporangium album]|uniref:Uncharacterized protein n=1 Tax=Sinosporangium album TaxID=504805 RepID=A0A1G7WUT6_9ACTN|nr:hypothetical protein [Sinosporangium album]SDG75070.1 hypothetical protein SAMN05421505_107179 [Sinosporangium album]
MADLFELRMGLYGAEAATEELTDKARSLLDEHSRRAPIVRAWALSSIPGDQPTEPGSEEELTVSELYEELPEQWRLEHPGAEPGDRRVIELRIGVYGDGLRELLDELSRLACPEPEHSSACPVPWSTNFTLPFDDHYRAYLEAHYGHLRRIMDT